MELWSFIPCWTARRTTWLESETGTKPWSRKCKHDVSSLRITSAATTLSLNCTIIIFTNVLFFLSLQIFHPRHDNPQSVLCWKESDRTENMINLYLVTIFKFTGAQSQENFSPCWWFSHWRLAPSSFFFSFIQYIDFLRKGIERKNMKIEKGRMEGTANQKKKISQSQWCALHVGGWWWTRWVRRTEPADIHDEWWLLRGRWATRWVRRGERGISGGSETVHPGAKTSLCQSAVEQDKLQKKEPSIMLFHATHYRRQMRSIKDTPLKD